MKNIQLKKLELTNYRNITHATYEFNGNSKIVGDNRIGKTNTLESIHWLLTGYLLNGSSDIQQIKPLADTRAVVSVFGTFDIDGKEITIGKKYGEEWARQRNTGVEVLKGHFTELWYNGTKQSTTREYNELFKEDFGGAQNEALKVSFLQMLTNPFYIGDLCDGDDWKEVRKLIIELVGDVQDEDVFNSEPNTRIIKSELEISNGRIDQVKKRVADEIKNLKDTLIADDAKIELLSKTELPEESALQNAKDQIKVIEEKIATLRSSSGNKEAELKLKNKIADINGKIAELRASMYKNANSDALSELNRKKNSILDHKQDVVSFINRLKYEIELANAKVDRLAREKQDLLDEYYDLKNAKVEVDTVCPTCKRPLDPSQIEKAKADFIANNQTKMEIIIVEGKKKAVAIEEQKKEIETITQKVEEAERVLNDTNEQLASINAEIEKANLSTSVPTESIEIEKLENERAEVQKELTALQTSEENARSEISLQIFKLEQDKAPYTKILNDADYYARQMQELDKCKVEKQTHSKTLVAKEQMKEMIQKFMLTKLQMLDSNVSKVFGNIKFQLIKENLNGGFDTVCKPYIYDPTTKTSTNVLWKSGSKSERVATGIAIAECVKAKLQLANMPYLFDEGGELSSETIKTRLQTESQIICVKVEDNLPKPIVLTL